jgi:hypothetical protein
MEGNGALYFCRQNFRKLAWIPLIAVLFYYFGMQFCRANRDLKRIKDKRDNSFEMGSSNLEDALEYEQITSAIFPNEFSGSNYLERDYGQKKIQGIIFRQGRDLEFLPYSLKDEGKLEFLPYDPVIPKVKVLTA